MSARLKGVTGVRCARWQVGPGSSRKKVTCAGIHLGHNNPGAEEGRKVEGKEREGRRG